MDDLIEMRGDQGAGQGVRQVSIDLARPQTRLRVRLDARDPGRAEAAFGGRSWAAKHYWEESGGVWIYEFDEALPAGPVTLRVPVAP